MSQVFSLFVVHILAKNSSALIAYNVALVDRHVMELVAGLPLTTSSSPKI